jgi:hypothetical protein
MCEQGGMGYKIIQGDQKLRTHDQNIWTLILQFIPNYLIILILSYSHLHDTSCECNFLLSSLMPAHLPAILASTAQGFRAL